MPLLVIGVVIFVVWLILNHIRKQAITKELINLQKLAMEKGLELPNKDLLQADTGSRTMSLRIAIISFCLGLAVFVITAIIPDLERGEREALIILRIIGSLILALGLGNFLSWLFIDRKR
jgi:hypothetical protein